MNPKLLTKLAVGDRIRAMQYGVEKTGTVTRSGRGVIFVRFDDSPRERWLHASSVKRECRFLVTYEIVTPESAEHGDAEERGYIAPGGMHVTDAAPMSLRDALNLTGCTEDSGTWFSETDGRMNYRTGAEERRALHPPRNITAASYARIKRLLRA